MVGNGGNRPVGILVLGMHRSGTSAVTGVLNKLGIPVPGELLPPAADNPKGFFENKASVDFNDKLLDHLTSQWDDPLAVSLDGFQRSGMAKPFDAELEHILRTEFLDRTPLFALKEPRLCRFVPIWRSALDKLSVDTKVIVVVRHPSEVADSLSTRDGLPRSKTLLLWLQHMLAAERDTRGMARSFLPYAGLMNDWRSAVGRIAVELDLVFPTERAKTESIVDDFLSRELRHHVATEGFGQGENATGLEALAARAFSAFMVLCRNRHDADATADLDAASRALGEASAIFAPYVAWEFRALNESRGRVAWLEETGRNAAAALAEAEAAAQRAAAALAEAETAAQRAAEALEEQLHSLRAEADAHAIAMNELRGTLNTLAGTLGALKGSTAWRMTGPLRRAADVLPASMRWHLRRLAKAGWWVMTPWRTPARLRFLRARRLGLAAQSAPQLTPAFGVAPPLRPQLVPSVPVAPAVAPAPSPLSDRT